MSTFRYIDEKLNLTQYFPDVNKEIITSVDESSMIIGGTVLEMIIIKRLTSQCILPTSRYYYLVQTFLHDISSKFGFRYDQIKAILAHLYVQYYKLDDLYDWFFSLILIEDSFQKYFISASPLVEYIQSMEPIIPVIEPVLSIEPVSEPVYVRRVQPSIQHEYRTDRFPIMLNLTDDGVYSIIGYNLFIRHDKGMKNNLGPRNVSNVDKLLFLQHHDTFYYPPNGGRVPLYSDFFSSPGDGWWGYYGYKKIEGVTTVVMYSDFVPTQDEFKMFAEVLAMQALTNMGIYRKESPITIIPIDTHFTFLHSNFKLSTGEPNDVLIPFLNFGYAIIYDVKIDCYNYMSFDGAKQILSNWDSSFLHDNIHSLDEFFDMMSTTDDIGQSRKGYIHAKSYFLYTNLDNIDAYIKRILNIKSDTYKLFCGKFSYYSSLMGKDVYGFGIKYKTNNHIGEIPLSYFVLSNEWLKLWKRYLFGYVMVMLNKYQITSYNTDNGYLILLDQKYYNIE